jgi:hypothetical protein
MPGAKKKIDAKLAEAFVAAAHSLFHDEGEIEIDQKGGDDAIAAVSALETLDEIRENGGMYVKAWVWVPYSELPESVQKDYGLDD